MAGNTPFKYFKQTVHEGGTRDPLIISWPKGIHSGGGIRGQFHHVNDIMPTLLDLAGIDMPAQVDGVTQQRLDGISMRYTFEHPETPTRKGPQYFEMYGNRGIWADGWMAVVAHNPQPWNLFQLRPVNDDVWELYHLRDDFNELHDVAASNPQKLQELRALFDVEAKRNNVYPILPDFVRRRRDAQLTLLQAHHGDFEFFGGERRIPEALAPPVLHRSFSITALIESTAGPVSGAIVAQGGNMGGYALYAIEGHPAFCYNYFGLNRYCVTSEQALPAGKSELRFEFAKTGPNSGQGALFINGQKAGEGSIDNTEPVFHSINESFDIGRDDGTPVVADYAGRDVFSGKIDRVLVHVEDH
jgi:arylsulfatase